MSSLPTRDHHDQRFSALTPHTNDGGLASRPGASNSGRFSVTLTLVVPPEPVRHE
jgi:hypothetical protein